MAKCPLNLLSMDITLSSHYRFSMGLRSLLWEGHFRALILVSFKRGLDQLACLLQVIVLLKASPFFRQTKAASMRLNNSLVVNISVFLLKVFEILHFWPGLFPTELTESLCFVIVQHIAVVDIEAIVYGFQQLFAVQSNANPKRTKV